MHQLNSEGYKVGRYKVRRIMRNLGLRAKTPKRFKLTTDSRHSLLVAANVLDRKFDVDTPNTVWTADITYVWTLEGWLYLASENPGWLCKGLFGEWEKNPRFQAKTLVGLRNYGTLSQDIALHI